MAESIGFWVLWSIQLALIAYLIYLKITVKPKKPKRKNKMKKLVSIGIALAIAVTIGSFLRAAKADQRRTFQPAAVILSLDQTSHYVTNDQGYVWAQVDGEIVEYATVSQYGPQGLVPGMNAADALAQIASAGLEPNSVYGSRLIFVRK